MLPYQAVAMEYASFHQHAAAQQHAAQQQAAAQRTALQGGLLMPVGPAAAFTHSWFVQAPAPQDMCRAPNSANQTHLEPGILELRKEKSRDAARSRRGKENFEFYELAKMLPLPAAITSQLDKASIIRLTISYLKLRDFSGHGDPPWSRDTPPLNKTLKGTQNRRSAAGMAMELFEQHQGTHILQSLDGFALSVAADGRFLYISETVSIYLGLSQVEMTGSSIFDYVHQADHAEIAEQLGLSLTGSGGGSSTGGHHSPGSAASEDGSQHGTNNPDVSASMTLASSGTLYRGMDRAFCIRMKSTLTKRGCHFKSSGYRVVLMLCRLRAQYTFAHGRKSQPPLLGMVALAIALPPPSVHEIRLESDMFVTRINFDFRIAHCEPKVSDILDYTADELTGKNLYALCHGEDANKLRKSHVDLINKGQVLTHYYRIMNKSGGFTWIQTCATVVCSSKNADEQNIICVNYVISGREYGNTIMDCCQMEESGPTGVKREEAGGDGENGGAPDGDRAGGGGDGGGGGGAGGAAPGPAGPRCSPRPAASPGAAPRAAHVTLLATAAPLASDPPRRSKKRKATPEPPAPPPPPPDDNHHKLAEKPSPKPAPIAEDNIISGDATSVKDLENAMSKHLPGAPLGAKEDAPPPQRPTDFSTDALLKQQQQKSTIQWIGAHNHLEHLNQQAQQPASALLRQLYANRESVIRANVGAAGLYAGDVGAGPLPTPPGSEGSAFGDHQFMALHGQKPTDAFGGLVSGYGAYGMDYHPAMTPPASVSPRDKQTASYEVSANGTPYGEHRPSYHDGQPLPLKPHAYSALDYTAPLEQQFYGTAGFHLYHPTPGKGNTNWYTTTS